MPSIIVRRKTATQLTAQVLTYKHQANKFLNVTVFQKMAPSGEAARKSTIRQVFLDVSMVNHHDGLVNIARKRKVDLSELRPGDFLLFINPSGTYCKIMGGNVNYARPDSPPMYPITSLKAPRGRISPLLLRELPKFFYGQPFDYDATLKPILEAHLASKARDRRGALKARVTEMLAKS